MDLMQKLFGTVTVEITSADTAAFLSLLHQNEIPVMNVHPSGAIGIILQINRKDFRNIKLLCKRRGNVIKLQKRNGVYWILKKTLSRPVLLFGISILILLSLFLPTKILFIEVNGNEMIPTNSILETARFCGIEFGASRKLIRSEQVKNKLLENMPQLQWAGINTYGCRAVISVSEKKEQSQPPENKGVASIVAVTDGIIESCTATKGDLLCIRGQAVKKGEVLISGYTDCGIIIRAVRAEGEVYANTLHNITMVVPVNYSNKIPNQRKYKKISVIIGKKRINLSRNSRISGAECDKIYKEFPIRLPGGFILPISLAIERWTGYNTEEIQSASLDVPLDFSSYAQRYLREQMISGSVLSKKEDWDVHDKVIIFQGKYFCHEMIGRIQTEEIINGKDH